MLAILHCAAAAALPSVSQRMSLPALSLREISPVARMPYLEDLVRPLAVLPPPAQQLAQYPAACLANIALTDSHVLRGALQGATVSALLIGDLRAMGVPQKIPLTALPEDVAMTAREDPTKC